MGAKHRAMLTQPAGLGIADAAAGPGHDGFMALPGGEKDRLKQPEKFEDDDDNDNDADDVKDAPIHG